jgi:hypothetical protein
MPLAAAFATKQKTRTKIKPESRKKPRCLCMFITILSIFLVTVQQQHICLVIGRLRCTSTFHRSLSYIRSAAEQLPSGHTLYFSP